MCVVVFQSEVGNSRTYPGNRFEKFTTFINYSYICKNILLKDLDLCQFQAQHFRDSSTFRILTLFVFKSEFYKLAHFVLNIKRTKEQSY